MSCQSRSFLVDEKEIRGEGSYSIMAGCMKEISIVTVENIKFIVLLLLLSCLPQKSCQATGSKPQVINIQHDQKLESSVFSYTGANHFCYINSIVPGWKQTWTRIQVGVWSSKELKVIVAEDEEKLKELESFGFWSMVQWLLHERSNETNINVSLFSKKRCFKVEPADGKTPYTVKPIRKFDIFLFAVFLAGVFLFMFADTLSRSQVFYYSTGMGTGLIASLIILIFIMSRFLPKKSPFYLLVVGGWSFSVYVIQLVFRNLNMILREHWPLVLGYTTVVGFISFAVCYRYGPLVDKRSVNILSWTLQLFGLMLIYAGIQIQSVALAIILAALCSKTLEYPVSLALSAWRKIKPSLRLRWKPEPRRLLTEEEYQIQGEEETRRALEELRKYCASPDINHWKTVSRIQSPKRFADFVEGSLHLMPNEVSDHAQDYGFGGSYFEDDLFATDEDEEDIKPS